MEKSYPVAFHERVVGTVKIQEQGLYYLLRCSCSLPKMQYVNLMMNREIVGILVPENGEFSLIKKIPRKNFSGDPVHFYLTEREPAKDSSYIVVSVEKPFLEISRLLEGRLIQTGNVLMIVVPN